MRYLIAFFLLFFLFSKSWADPQWTYNPFTGQMDYFETANGTAINITNLTVQSINATGNITTNYFLGNGSLLSGIPQYFQSTPPTAPNDVGTRGNYSINATHLFACNASGDWKRVAWDAWAILRYPTYWQGIKTTWNGVDTYK